MIRLFVYGTLLSGEDNHYLIQRADFLCPTHTAPAFSLVDLGGYPAMVAGGGTSIAGELYHVDLQTLARLDLFEEVPELYRRVQINIAGSDTAAYVLPQTHAGSAPIIPSGSWRKRA
ncbi:MAG: gamma-glutamylcyclotransferase [Myxococcales bacterium]|nr:gamma-glutamylcyclotransferase [Myxococcales bacterium]